VVKKSVGQILGASPVPLTRVAPALFTANVQPEGQLAAVNVEDGTINSSGNPVARGQFISLYGTGMGPVSGAPAEGAAVDGPVPGVDQVRVLIGDLGFVPQENIQYFGLAPGFVGVYQINVKVPETVAPGGSVDVVVEVRSMLSNRMDTTPQRILKTTIAVKP
jgi:uncharacterized protein (TIGR03437 family)